jgi:hypothetical protein
MKIRVLTLVLFVLALLLVPVTALADDGTTIPPIVDLYSFIDLAKFILAGGVGVAVSLVVEWWPKFNKMKPKSKFWAIFGLFVGFPLVAQLLIHIAGGFPTEAITALNAYVAALIYGVTGWVASQWSHKLDLKLSPNK